MVLLYVVWYKILHIPYQMNKLDKSQSENEAGEAKGATPFSFCSKNNLKKKNVIIIIIVCYYFFL